MSDDMRTPKLLAVSWGRLQVEGSAPERISSSTRAAAENGRRRTCGRAVPLDLLTSRNARSCPVIEMACGTISLRRHYPDQVLGVAGQLLRCRLLSRSAARPVPGQFVRSSSLSRLAGT